MIQDDYIAEVESIFPELVFLYENGKQIDPFQSSYNMFESLTSNYRNADAIIFHRLIANTWRENNYQFTKKTYEDLKKEYYLTRKDIRDFLDTFLEQHGPYVISFAVVLELFNLYKKDKEKALYYYKKIISAPYTEEALLTLLKLEKELPLFEHTLEESQEITSSFSKELSRKM